MKQENKINIAELLKDCPKGMELDCTMYDNVEFDYVEQSPESAYPIHCLIKINGGYNALVFTHNGCNDRHPNAKCVIFPKGKTTWEGFVPPCKFKDGDVVYAIDEGNEYIFIFKEIYENERVYCYLNLKGGDLRIQEVWLTDYNPTHRLATEEEKQKLFDTIKANGYKWNEKTKTLEKLPKFKIGDRVKHISAYASGIVVKISDKGYHIDYPKGEGICYISFELEKDYELASNKFDTTTLNPFDKVLVRDFDKNIWGASIFSNTWKNKYYCVGLWHNQCIPYEGNEHLLGTTDDCDEYYKNW